VQRCKSALCLESVLVKVHNEWSPIIGLFFFVAQQRLVG